MRIPGKVEAPPFSGFSKQREQVEARHTVLGAVVHEKPLGAVQVKLGRNDPVRFLQLPQKGRIDLKLIGQNDHGVFGSQRPRRLANFTNLTKPFFPAPFRLGTQTTDFKAGPFYFQECFRPKAPSPGDNPRRDGPLQRAHFPANPISPAQPREKSEIPGQIGGPSLGGRDGYLPIAPQLRASGHKIIAHEKTMEDQVRPVANSEPPQNRGLVFGRILTVRKIHQFDRTARLQQSFFQQKMIIGPAPHDAEGIGQAQNPESPCNIFLGYRTGPTGNMGADKIS